MFGFPDVFAPTKLPKEKPTWAVQYTGAWALNGFVYGGTLGTTWYLLD